MVYRTSNQPAPERPGLPWRRAPYFTVLAVCLPCFVGIPGLSIELLVVPLGVLVAVLGTCIALVQWKREPSARASVRLVTFVVWFAAWSSVAAFMSVEETIADAQEREIFRTALQFRRTYGRFPSSTELHAALPWRTLLFASPLRHRVDYTIPEDRPLVIRVRHDLLRRFETDLTAQTSRYVDNDNGHDEELPYRARGL